MYTWIFHIIYCLQNIIVDREIWLMSHMQTLLLFFSLPSIRQYELKIHEDLNMNKIYTGELGRLKSFENQKPYVIRHHSTCVGFHLCLCVCLCVFCATTTGIIVNL